MKLLKPNRNNLIVGAVCGVLGYFVGITSSDKDQNSEKTSSSAQRSPGLGEKKSNEFPSSSNKPNAHPGWKQSPLDTLMSQYSRMTPDQIFDELKKLSHSGSVEDLLLYDEKFKLILFCLGNRLGKLSPKDALLQTQQLSAIKLPLTREIMKGWAENNPEAAGSYYLENINYFPNPDWIQNELAQALGKGDPEYAWTWMNSLEKTEEKNSVLPHVMTGIIENHPEQAGKYMVQVEDLLKKQNEVLSKLVKKWTSADWSSAKNWITRQEEEVQNRLMGVALGVLANTNLDTATLEFEQLSPKNKKDMAGTLIQGIPFDSPAQTIKWMEEHLPEELALERSFAAIHPSYLQDPDLVRQVVAMKRGAFKDEIIQVILHSATLPIPRVNAVNYANNLELASGLSNQEESQRQQRSVISEWINKSPEKALDWIKKSSLSPVEKQKYTQACEKQIKDKK